MSKAKLARLALLVGAGLLFAGGCGASGLTNLLPWAIGAGVLSAFLQSQGG